MDKLIKKLTRIAKERYFSVFMISCDRDLFSHSHANLRFIPCSECSITERHISIHYYDKFSKLAIFTHEVGHIITDGEDTALNEEIKASKWALQWLKDNGIKGLDKFARFYLYCLKSYDPREIFKSLKV